MAVGELSDEALMAALRAHPELRQRVSSIVLAVEGDEGALKEADAAEERMVEETRLLGRDYRQALAEGLPIGSGEIESAHRYLAQQRLKRPGAWWRVEHAEHMLALRINRINGDWDAYWKALARQPAAAANDNSPNKSLRRTA